MSERADHDAELPSDRECRNLTAWSLLAGLLLLAALAGPFFAGRIYTADDLGAFHLPVRAFYAERLARGQPYDWMPNLYSGFYLTGEGQAGFYHPLHQLLYRTLELPAALGLEYLLSYPLMMFGTWLWLRRRLGRSDAAMLGGLLFTFSSFNLLHFVHPNAVAVIAHVPWLLWAIDVVLLDSPPRKVTLATVLIALLTGSQLLLGYPQYVWFSLLAEVSYTMFLLTTRKYVPRSGCDLQISCGECIGCATEAWPRVVIAKEIGLLIGGVQLLPTLDAWLHSTRISADAGFCLWGSLHPLNLLQLVAPYLFVNRLMGGNTHEIGLYAGAVPLLLCVWAAARRRELGSLAPLARATLGFAAVALLLALGGYGWLDRITAWLPIVGSFRFPCRYLVLFQLAVAVLATLGFVLLSRQSGQARRRRSHGDEPLERRLRLALWRDFRPLWYIVGLSAAVAIIWQFCQEPQVASAAAAAWGPALLAAGVILMAAAARGHSTALVAMILLAALDLGCYWWTYAVYPQSATLAECVASASAPPGEPDGRVVASLRRFDEAGLRTGDLMTICGWRRADGYAGLEPAQKLDYHLLPALRVAGVRWVQRDPTTAGIAGLKPCNDRWMEVPDPLPRVRLVTRTRTGSDPAFDLARICPDTTAISEVPLELPPSRPGLATVMAESPGRFEIEVDCPARQLLVVAESYHSGWQAAVDGMPQEVYRINGDFMGCVVGPGKSRVILRFQPESLRRGWLTSLLGLSLISLCFLGCKVQAKPSHLEDPLR